jgi:ABC-type multidrug transport system fused ATPase/permease subunit
MHLPPCLCPLSVCTCLRAFALPVPVPVPVPQPLPPPRCARASSDHHHHNHNNNHNHNHNHNHNQINNAGHHLLIIIIIIIVIKPLTQGIIFAGYRIAAERASGDSDCAYSGTCSISAGSALLAIFGINMAAQGFGLIMQSLSSFSRARAAAGTMKATMDRTPAIDALSDAGATPASVAGRVEFRNVQFHYPTRPDAPVYTDFCLTVEPGQTVALVGGSGSGARCCSILIISFNTYTHTHMRCALLPYVIRCCLRCLPAPSRFICCMA